MGDKEMYLVLGPEDFKSEYTANIKPNECGNCSAFCDDLVPAFYMLTEEVQNVVRSFVLNNRGEVFVKYWEYEGAHKKECQVKVLPDRCLKCGGEIDRTRWLGPGTSRYAMGPKGPFALYECKNCHALHHNDGSLSEKELSALEVDGG